jgi:hypothetical protein
VRVTGARSEAPTWWRSEDVSQNTVDVAGRTALRLLDHFCRAIEGIDLITSPGKPGCERSGTAADIQHPPAARRHLAEQQPVIIRIVIPVERLSATGNLRS